MRSNAKHHQHLAPLTLAFLLFGLLGCSNGSEARQGENDKPAPQGQAQTQPSQGQAAPLQGQAPAAPGQPAPGAAPPAATTEPKVDTEKLPAVVARVNGQDIAKGALLEEAQQLRGQFLQRGARPDQLEGQTFYRQVLDGLIARTLLEAEARAGGVVVSDEDLQKEMTTLRAQFPSPEIFDQAMAAQGLDDAKLKDNLKRQILVRKFLETKVIKGGPTEQDMKAFYDQNQDKMKQPERAHLRHILVKVDEKAPEADKQKARAKADSLLARAKGGEDFAKLARESSDDPGSKERGGDLGMVARGATVPPFEQAAFALQKPNELSPVVETQYGYHVIQLLEHKPADVASFDEVKERISAFLKQRQSTDQVQAHLRELRAKAKVEMFI